MNSKTLYATLAGGVLLAACALVSAQRSVTFSRDGRPERIFRPVSGLNSVDATFLKNAAYVNMFELQAAKVAADRGSSDFTKEYAKEMMTDHTMALDHLKKVASDKGVVLPSELPNAQQHSINFLSSLNGGDFDGAYRRTQIDGHQMAAGMFQSEISNGHDEDVKGYAVLTLPEVKLHQRLAMQQKTMMGSTKADHNG
jgi:putative membrane protein